MAESGDSAGIFAGMFADLLKFGAGIAATVTAFIVGRSKVKSKEKQELASFVENQVRLVIGEYKTLAAEADAKADKALKLAEESDRKHEECKEDRKRLWSENAMLRQKLGVNTDPPKGGA
jgi:hypothetical protein